MRISLIQPRWRIETDSLCDPLNLGYLASYLRKKGYRDIKMYSAVFDSDRKIIVGASQSDIVGLNVLSSMWKHVKTLSSKIKKRNPNVKIVIGGVHPSALPEETLRNKNIDFVVRGEGEVTFYELIEALQGARNLEDVDGISYKKNGRIFHNKNRELIEDLDSLPFPARDLMVQESYIRKYYQVWGKRSVSLLTSRGCPYSCSCCASGTVWNRRWRARSPANIIEELKQVISRYNVDEVHFEDANFGVNKERVIKICDLIVKKKLGITWNCLMYPNNIDKDMLMAMKYAGCKTIGIGVESGSYKILKEYGKTNVDLGRVKRIFKISKDLGINRIAFVMLGLPSENRDTIQKTKRLLQNMQPEYATCSLLVPFPGTRFYHFAKEKGYVKDDFDWSDLYYTRVYLPTNSLSKNELYKEYMKLLKSLTCFWRRRKIKFWSIYYKLKVEFSNCLPTEYPFLFYRMARHIFLTIFNRMFKPVNL